MNSLFFVSLLVSASAVDVFLARQAPKFATAGGAGRPTGYRNAWDDCGGVGASATERMRTIAAEIKGWAKPLPFVRHAAQDCGIDPSGTKPGPVEARIFPAPAVVKSAEDGLATAAETQEK